MKFSDSKLPCVINQTVINKGDPLRNIRHTTVFAPSLCVRELRIPLSARRRSIYMPLHAH